MVLLRSLENICLSLGPLLDQATLGFGVSGGSRGEQHQEQQGQQPQQHQEQQGQQQQQHQ